MVSVVILSNHPQFRLKVGSMITGDVFYMKVLGSPIVVLNSEKAARDLLEKRSSIYNDRPPVPGIQL